MKANICYKIITSVEMEISDKFKELTEIYNRDFSQPKDTSKWDILMIELDVDIFNKLPANTTEILGVYNTETNEIIYEN